MGRSATTYGLALLLWLCVPLTGEAAVIKDSQSQGTCGGCTTLTVSHTVGTGTERFLLVQIPWLQNGAHSITGVTYGGVALTYIGTTGSAGCAGGYSCTVQTWKLVAPNSGTADIVVSSTANYEISLIASSYTGVDPTDPHGTLTTATGTGATPSVTISSDSTQVLSGGVIVESNVSPSGGATQLGNLLGGNGFTVGAASYMAGASSVTYGWTASGSAKWAISVLPLKSSTGGGGGGGGGTTFFTETLLWNDNATNEGWYSVQWKHTTQPSYADILFLPANSTSYTVQYTTETQRCYRVQAHNEGGDSPFSNELCASVVATGPILPTLTAPSIGGGIGDAY